MYPTETWTGPEAGALSMGRLAGGGALQSDTCNTAEKAKTLLAEMVATEARAKIGEERWAEMSSAEQEAATRVRVPPALPKLHPHLALFVQHAGAGMGHAFNAHLLRPCTSLLFSLPPLSTCRRYISSTVGNIFATSS